MTENNFPPYKIVRLAELAPYHRNARTHSPDQVNQIADNKIALNAGWDDALLQLELGELRLGGFDMSLTGFAPLELDDIFNPPGDPEPSRSGNLAAQFGIPPFSVLNAREGWWQDRKRAWLALGIQSELGRGETESDASFKNQGAQSALMDGKPHRRPNAIPGGGSDAVGSPSQAKPSQAATRPQADR